MSDTPRTDDAQFEAYAGAFRRVVVPVELARQLERELAEARRDAERYMWLRDQKNDDGIVIAMKNKHIDDSLPYSVNIDRYIDAAIDAAMKS